MPRGYASLAEYYRAHREAMELALATGCTPVEAERELRRRGRERRQTCGTRAPARSQEADGSHEFQPQDAPPADFSDWRASWMMRD